MAPSPARARRDAPPELAVLELPEIGVGREPVLAALLHAELATPGERHPAAETDDHGAVVCVNTAALADG